MLNSLKFALDLFYGFRTICVISAEFRFIIFEITQASLFKTSMLMLFGISILPIAVIIFPPAVTLVSGPMQNSFVHWVWLSLLVSKWNLRSRLTRLVPICRACHVTYHQNISSMNLRLNVVLIFWNDQKTSTCKYFEKMLSIDHVTRSLTCDISIVLSEYRHHDSSHHCS